MAESLPDVRNKYNLKLHTNCNIILKNVLPQYILIRLKFFLYNSLETEIVKYD